VVNDAALQHGLILHTLVDPHLRTSLIHLAQMQGVIAVDLVGDLLTHLAGVLGQEPLIHPGRYRQINEVYFKRVEAMEFTIAHDDGNRPQDWPLAEIVLAGLSRVGKTPLSVYLSLQGWKVANVPLVMGLPSPPELFELDRRRVIGLHLEPGQLLFHRQQRQRQLGAPGPSAYIDPVKIYEEVEAARREFKRGGFSVIDITDKPVETIADEVIELMTRRFKTNP
jgi:regulator of PEP synthase PpsR (kinase-PPPase family)